MDISIQGIPEAVKYLERFEKLTTRGIKKALFIIGDRIRKEAWRNAPMSPKRGQIIRDLRARGSKPRRRRATSTSGAKPGTLAGAIKNIVIGNEIAKVFVPTNSNAGDYADIMENKKGILWHNRGLGTRLRGSRADEKYVYRAGAAAGPMIVEVTKSAIGRETGVYPE